MYKIISKEFVESILKEEIIEFSIGRGSAVGDNFASELISLKVKTKKGETIDLVHKTLPQSEHRNFAISNQIFKTEIEFYKNVVPHIEKLVNRRLNSSSSSSSKYQLPVPKFVDGFSDNENDYITLEDLRSKDYKMMNKFVGFNIEQVTMILKELAKFHAYSYFLIKYEGEKIFDESGNFYIFNKNYLLKEESKEFTRGMVTKSYENTIQFVRKSEFYQKSEYRMIHEMLLEFVKPCEMLNILLEIPLRTDKDTFPVLVHGDLWVNNILIHDDQNGKTKSIKFIDFQLCRRGTIYEDLLYFIFTSTTTDFRKQHLTTSLNLYFKEFVNALNSMKCPLPLHFSKKDFLVGFNEGLKSTFVSMTFLIPMQLNIQSDEEEKEEEEDTSENDDNQEKNTNSSDHQQDDRKNGEEFANKLWIQFQKSPVAVERFQELVKEIVVDLTRF